MSSLSLMQSFLEYTDRRSELKIQGKYEAILDYTQYLIRIQFDKNQSKKYQSKKKKKNLIPQAFVNAFKACTREEKVKYYIRHISYILRLNQGKTQPFKTIKKFTMVDSAFTLSYNLGIWKKKRIRLQTQRLVLYAENEKDKKIKTYSMYNYLARRSENKTYYTIALEAINQKPHEKSRTVRIGFIDSQTFQYWYQSIEECIECCEWEDVRNTMFGTQKQQNLNGKLSPRFSNVSEPINNNFQQQNQRIKRKSDMEKQTVLVNKIEDETKVNQKQIPIQQLIIKKESGKEQSLPRRQTISQMFISNQMLEPFQVEQMIEEEEQDQKNEKRGMDIFHNLFPEYDVSKLGVFSNHQCLNAGDDFNIMRDLGEPKKVKFTLRLPLQEGLCQNLVKMLTMPDILPKINDEVEEVQIKTMIASENTAVMYLKLKAYNKLYRSRDFVFVRHVFKSHGGLYIADKSLDNCSYPPFMTIVRGELKAIWGVTIEEQTLLFTGDLEMDNSGYLNETQNFNLIIRYLRGFNNLSTKITHIIQKSSKAYKIFDLDWDTDLEKSIQSTTTVTKNTNKDNNLPKDKTEKSQINNGQGKKDKVQLTGFAKKDNQKGYKEEKSIEKQKISNLQKPSSKSHDDKRVVAQKVQMKKQEHPGEIKSQPQKIIVESKRQHTTRKIIRQFNDEGLVIIDQSFVRTRYLLEPFQCQKYYYQRIGGHHLWKGEFRRDEKAGALIFVDEKKIEDQKSVLKFILSKIGKNLISGKSVLNISLPVDIFMPQSNLERLAICMGYAPIYIDPAVNAKPLDRFLDAIKFGISNSLLYLNMEKPFNPILGQTIQCWVNGCPIYGQQISHHPPISAIYFKGRGYTISTYLQSKVQLHLNSGTGINEGIFRICFEDGEQINFITPGGQVSGLTYGDRKFNLVGKSYYWMPKHNFYLEIVFNPSKKGFFSVGKQQNPSDYFQGNICQAKPEFIDKLLKEKKKELPDKEKIRDIGKVSGIWNKYIKFDQKQIVDFDNSVGIKIQYEACPLPSDANWREDIAYRRINQITTSQSHKERLEALQRKDKKLRGKH